MREISLDTETTGGNIKQGDRAIDIGLVEMFDGRRTGRTWQTYLDPQSREVHWGALRVHGLSNAFLKGKPLFKDVADEMLAFIDGAPCIAHNARFDRDVVITEFHVCGLELPQIRFHDSISMAKDVLKTGKMNLDTVVARLGITTPPRKTHGALLDAEILAMVIEALEDLSPGARARMLHPGLAIDPVPSFLKQRGLQSWSASPTATLPADVEQEQPTVGSGLNPGVADSIRALNATDGPADRGVADAMRCGSDMWTATDLRTVTAVAQSEVPSEVIKLAFEGLPEKDIIAGLRWICRGLQPDRYLAVKCYWNDKLPQDRIEVVRAALQAVQAGDCPQP
jgi:DNA polymerase-3 subunit epsilon